MQDWSNFGRSVNLVRGALLDGGGGEPGGIFLWAKVSNSRGGI